MAVSTKSANCVLAVGWVGDPTRCQKKEADGVFGKHWDREILFFFCFLFCLVSFGCNLPPPRIWLKDMVFGHGSHRSIGPALCSLYPRAMPTHGAEYGEPCSGRSREASFIDAAIIQCRWCESGGPSICQHSPYVPSEQKSMSPPKGQPLQIGPNGDAYNHQERLL